MRRLAPTLATAVIAVLGSCSAEPAGPAISATIAVRADLAGTAVTLVIVEVTATDIPAPLVFNLTASSNVASGNLTIPAGSDRTVTVRAYDAAGILTHSGSALIGVLPGANPTLSIVLFPMTGGIWVTVTLGNLTVTVSPASFTLPPGGSVTLSASITDVNGVPVAGTVAWATRDPGIATVSATGQVTGRGSGSTTISATYQGASGNTTITVTP